MHLLLVTKLLTHLFWSKWSKAGDSVSGLIQYAESVEKAPEMAML